MAQRARSRHLGSSQSLGGERLTESAVFYSTAPTLGKLNSAYNVAVVKKRRLEVLVGRARVPKFRRMAGHGSRDRNVGDVNRQMTVDRNFSE